MVLWDDIYVLNMNMQLPWLIGGDFNIIISCEKKIVGLPVYPQECKDFAFYDNSCDLVDVKFKGSPFTWWSGWTDNECIFRILDRILVN